MQIEIGKQYVVSLSGGGYRAALYHAGILRTLYETGLFGKNSKKVIICAVSGGAIPTLIWDRFLRCEEDFQQKNYLWPEIQLLNLIENSPFAFGRWNWAVKGWYFKAKEKWLKYLESWWWGAINTLPTIVPKKPDHLFLVELLDFNSGEILIYHGEKIFEPGNEFFKQFVKWGNITSSVAKIKANGISEPQALAIATAFPGYFRSWNLEENILIDAGLIDNQAIMAIRPLLDTINEPFLQREDIWVFANAGGTFNIPVGSEILDAWNRIRIVKKLSLSDKVLRYAGTLAQNSYMDVFSKLLRDYVGIKTYGFRIGFLPESDLPWLQGFEHQRPSDLASTQTTLSRISRRNALCLMAQGAQLSSHALLFKQKTKRDEIGNNLRSLIKAKPI